jgi:tRNA 2-thiouridine synthesizing protein A
MEPSHDLDLRGVHCPLSWAKTKIRLETLGKGEELTVRIDDPKGARDIPRAAESEGYAAEVEAESDGLWRIRIRV